MAYDSFGILDPAADGPTIEASLSRGFRAIKIQVGGGGLARDIASLQSQGAHIDGEPGMGYLLRPGFMLPPLMFSEEEIEAIEERYWRGEDGPES